MTHPTVTSAVCTLFIISSVQEEDMLDRLLANVYGREEQVNRLREVRQRDEATRSVGQANQLWF